MDPLYRPGDILGVDFTGSSMILFTVILIDSIPTSPPSSQIWSNGNATFFSLIRRCTSTIYEHLFRGEAKRNPKRNAAIHATNAPIASRSWWVWLSVEKGFPLLMKSSMQYPGSQDAGRILDLLKPELVCPRLHGGRRSRHAYAENLAEIQISTTT